jgi:hypothetical protein
MIAAALVNVVDHQLMSTTRLPLSTMSMTSIRMQRLQWQLLRRNDATEQCHEHTCPVGELAHTASQVQVRTYSTPMTNK